jgi:hypothetical protein
MMPQVLLSHKYGDLSDVRFAVVVKNWNNEINCFQGWAGPFMADDSTSLPAV